MGRGWSDQKSVRSGWSSKNPLGGTAALTASTKSIEFDGVNENIQVTDDPFLLSNNMSLAFWIKTSASGTDYIVDGYNGDINNRCWGISLRAGGQIGCVISEDGSALDKQIDTSVTFNDGAWHSYVLTYASGTVKMYKDATEDTSLTVSTDNSGTSIYNTASVSHPYFKIGSTRANSLYLAAKVDGLALWSTAALTGSDVTTFHNGGTAVDPSELSLSGTLVVNCLMGENDDLESSNGFDLGFSNTGTAANMTNSTDITTDVPS
jgi:hypothetical protein